MTISFARRRLTRAAAWLAGPTALTLALSAAGPAAAQSPCGPLPVPPPHCLVGACVDGEWEMVCSEDPFSPCGPKPIPAEGCRIDECVDGRWVETCFGVEVTPSEEPDCGIKPIPPGGCVIGECIGGAWEMTCQ